MSKKGCLKLSGNGRNGLDAIMEFSLGGTNALCPLVETTSTSDNVPSGCILNFIVTSPLIIPIR